jgi:hypothetical protein
VAVWDKWYDIREKPVLTVGDSQRHSVHTKFRENYQLAEELKWRDMLDSMVISEAYFYSLIS